MSSIVALIEQIAVGLYILLGVAILIALRGWLRARYDYLSTNFELERDLARFKQGGAFFNLVMLIELFLLVVGVQNIVAPTMREDMLVRGDVVEETTQVIDGEFATPTRPAPAGEVPFDPNSVDLGGEQAVQVFATAALTATPVGTIESAPDVIGCEGENATLQIPANGMVVHQPITVTGTAFIDNFSSYKLEIARPDGEFSVLDAGSVPVNENGALSSFNPLPYEPGTYRFQLMVFDTEDVLRASCRVTIYISDPIPTATPIGAE